MTPPPFPVFVSSGTLHVTTLDAFAGCIPMGMRGRYRTVSVSFVTRLSLGGLNAGIAGAVLGLLTVVSLTRRRTCHSLRV